MKKPTLVVDQSKPNPLAPPASLDEAGAKSSSLVQFRFDAAKHRLGASLHLTFAETQNDPSFVTKGSVHLTVFFDIALDFRTPKWIHPCFQLLIIPSMPEVAI